MAFEFRWSFVLSHATSLKPPARDEGRENRRGEKKKKKRLRGRRLDVDGDVNVATKQPGWT